MNVRKKKLKMLPEKLEKPSTSGREYKEEEWQEQNSAYLRNKKKNTYFYQCKFENYVLRTFEDGCGFQVLWRKKAFINT